MVAKGHYQVKKKVCRLQFINTGAIAEYPAAREPKLL